MKNRIITSGLRAVKSSFPRFLSLFIMSLLGVGVFAGLQATGPDMMNTLDRYLDEGRAYDICAVSSMGFTNDDIDAVSAADGVLCAEGSKQDDLFLQSGTSEYVVRAVSLPENINELTVISGALPSNPGEIAVEQNMAEDLNLKEGKTVCFQSGDISQTVFTVTGVVSSPLYFNQTRINRSRGKTDVGGGTVNYYAYIMPQDFAFDYYTHCYITVSGAAELVTADDGYVSLVSEVKDNIKAVASVREDARYNEIYGEAERQISENEEAAERELKEAKEGLDETKEYLDGVKKSLALSKSRLDAADYELNLRKEEYQNALSAAEISEDALESTADSLDKTVSALGDILSSLSEGSDGYAENYERYLTAKTQLEAVLQLLQAKNEISAANSEYLKNVSSYDAAVSKYNEGLKEYEEKLSEYQSAEAQTESEISKAREELGDIPFPVWNVSDRTGYSTYNDFDNDSSSIKNLSVLFPTVFFVVAVLISLITMNRMIEEDRVLLGTLKSLGFSNGRIMFRYLFFSLAATVSGGIAGAALGVCIIPSIIWNIYNILFDIPGFRLGFNLIYTAAGLLISIICICGTSLYTVKKELRSKPAELLRPKAPKNGKRVFLEKIGFVWKRLNFSHKVTVRNLFRYKKRAVTTVVGITGCTALILSGFGLRDSITDIPTVHFGEVFIYDDMVYVDSSADKARLDAAFDDSRIMSRTDCHLLSCKSGDYDVTVFVPDSADEIQNAVSLKELETGQTVDLPDSGVIITDKLSSLTGLKAGDKIAVSDSVGTACEFNISAVVQNYIGHYVFMTKQCYENSFGEYSTNVVYLKTVQNEPQEQSGFVSELLKSEAVFSVSDAAGLKADVDNMLKSLNSVVLILIILSSLLSFTVLYNLSNININERKREIATLKVLGFYHREVDRYITRETVILTAAGIVLGLVLGRFLTEAIISTVEIESVRFIRGVSPMSYVYSAAIASVFTLIVNFITHFTLKKINMIESLKSVE